MELVQMSKRELERYTVMRQLEEQLISRQQAALALDLSERQVRRLWKDFQHLGAAGLISKRRGQPSNRAIKADRRAHIMELVSTHYPDFGPTLACEYLQREHGCTISSETLRQWMIASGMWKPKVKRTRRHHSRDRRPRLGELIQIDGSTHDWFEGRSDKCTLIAFIDDARSQVMAARFFEAETSAAYLALLKQYISRHGKPWSLYSDRHAIFTKHDPEDPDPTQYGRAVLQLNIESIHARSPQAKGRIERLFQTLQDRMVKAMRLEGIDDMQSANAWLDGYIQRHNEQFAVQPMQAEDAHKPFLGTPAELARICALIHTRTLNKAGNCKFHGDILQVIGQQHTLPKRSIKVQVIEHTHGEMELMYQGRSLPFKAFGCYEHLKQQAEVDDKTINARIHLLLSKTQSTQHQKLAAQLSHQDYQRQQGIYEPTHHTSQLE